MEHDWRLIQKQG